MSDLKSELLSGGHRFSFFQAIRLLRLLNEGDVEVHPELSLGFPAGEIADLQKRLNGKGFRLDATFFGLYGPSSPLPAFYTEDLLKDFRDDSSAAREFLDVFNQRLFSLLYDAWKKYRFFLQLAEDQNERSLAIVRALSGCWDKESIYSSPRYAGMLGRHPRSALGLKTILTDFLGDAKVDVLSCIPRTVQISPEQTFGLGSLNNRLGEDAVLGQEIKDLQGKFRVRIGPLSEHRFRSIVFEGEEQKALNTLIQNYLSDPLEYDLEVLLAAEELSPARLGETRWSGLGVDTLLFSGQASLPHGVIFGQARPLALTG